MEEETSRVHPDKLRLDGDVGRKQHLCGFIDLPFRSPAVRGVSGIETASSLAVLALIAAVAVAVWFQQFRYDPTLFHSAPPPSRDGITNDSLAAPAAGPGLTSVVPETLKPMGAAESFDRETLSDKIDGRAELYLEAGFVRLDCQRFALAAKSDAWLELFVYDMTNATNAFAVFSAQRRPGTRDSAIAPLAYTTDNAIFFAHGKDYVEAVGSVADPVLVEALSGIARQYVASRPAEEESVLAFSLLPKEGLAGSSIRLVLKDAFGFDRLDNVVTGDYGIAGTTSTAFLSVRRSPEEASHLAQAYFKLLTVDLGADAVETTRTAVDGLRVANALGDYELVFSRGKVLGGVHAAKSLDAAMETARRLNESIGGREK